MCVQVCASVCLHVCPCTFVCVCAHACAHISAVSGDLPPLPAPSSISGSPGESSYFHTDQVLPQWFVSSLASDLQSWQVPFEKRKREPVRERVHLSCHKHLSSQCHTPGAQTNDDRNPRLGRVHTGGLMENVLSEGLGAEALLVSTWRQRGSWTISHMEAPAPCMPTAGGSRRRQPSGGLGCSAQLQGWGGVQKKVHLTGCGLDLTLQAGRACLGQILQEPGWV